MLAWWSSHECQESSPWRERPSPVLPTGLNSPWWEQPSPVLPIGLNHHWPTCPSHHQLQPWLSGNKCWGSSASWERPSLTLPTHPIQPHHQEPGQQQPWLSGNKCWGSSTSWEQPSLMLPTCLIHPCCQEPGQQQLPPWLQQFCHLTMQCCLVLNLVQSWARCWEWHLTRGTKLSRRQEGKLIQNNAIMKNSKQKKVILHSTMSNWWRNQQELPLMPTAAVMSPTEVKSRTGRSYFMVQCTWQGQAQRKIPGLHLATWREWRDLYTDTLFPEIMN